MKQWPVSRLIVLAALPSLILLWTLPAEARLARLGGELQINSSSFGNPSAPAVAALPDGGFFIVWRSEILGETAVLGRRFAPDGAPLGLDFQVSSEPPQGSTYPRVAAATDGTILVAWDAAVAPSVVGRFFNNEGTPLGEERVLTEPETPFGFEPAVDATENGEFVVAWTDSTDRGYEILARRFTANSDPSGPSFTVGADALEAGQIHPSVAAGLGESFLVTWYAEPSVEVQGQVFQGSAPSSSTEPCKPILRSATRRQHLCIGVQAWLFLLQVTYW